MWEHGQDGSTRGREAGMVLAEDGAWLACISAGSSTLKTYHNIKYISQGSGADVQIKAPPSLQLFCLREAPITSK